MPFKTVLGILVEKRWEAWQHSSGSAETNTCCENDLKILTRSRNGDDFVSQNSSMLRWQLFNNKDHFSQVSCIWQCWQCDEIPDRVVPSWLFMMRTLPTTETQLTYLSLHSLFSLLFSLVTAKFGSEEFNGGNFLSQLCTWKAEEGTAWNTDARDKHQSVATLRCAWRCSNPAPGLR